MADSAAAVPALLLGRSTCFFRNALHFSHRGRGGALAGRKNIFSTNLPNAGDLDEALIRPSSLAEIYRALR